MKVYTVADNIVSPLGFNTEENYYALTRSTSGIKKIEDSKIYPEAFFGARIDNEKVEEAFPKTKSTYYTLLEKLFICSIQDTLSSVSGIDKERLLLIISTTKGNIDLLDNTHFQEIPRERSFLMPMAQAINDFFHFKHSPVIVSNACISGISALLAGKRLIEQGKYDHVLVVGGDLLSEFVVAGFQCLKAISEQPCKPYDAARKGVTLGEACGTILLSNNPRLCTRQKGLSRLLSGGQSNDANHISGPSRTGKGLKIAISNALENGGLKSTDIGYINAHGTATSFNDEMESIAFNDLEMGNIPLNSLKGYFGHTLGAAGIIETIITIRQLNESFLLKSLGMEKRGVSKEINVLTENTVVNPFQYAMKTASGFGGCNAALIIEKYGTGNAD